MLWKKEKYKSLRSENVFLVLSNIEDLGNFVFFHHSCVEWKREGLTLSFEEAL